MEQDLFALGKSIETPRNPETGLLGFTLDAANEGLQGSFPLGGIGVRIKASHIARIGSHGPQSTPAPV